MLLVASHVKYEYAWQVLRRSLLDAGWPLTRVVRVVAGADQEACVVLPDAEVTIAVPFNFYEMTAVYGLHRFIDHARLRADRYLLIHDTCIVQTGFPVKCEAFFETMRTGGYDVYHGIDFMNLNIVALTYDFVKEHGARYGRDGDKHAAWNAELGGDNSFRSLVAPNKVGAGKDPFVFGGGHRVYGSDIVRHAVELPTLGVVKFVANNDADVNPPWQQRDHP
jgi:hypothetical protein